MFFQRRLHNLLILKILAHSLTLSRNLLLLKHTAKKLEKKGMDNKENGVREKKAPPYLATRGDTSAHTRPYGHPNTNWVTQITPITLSIYVF